MKVKTYVPQTLRDYQREGVDAMKSATWRGGSASSGQVKLLKKLGVKNVQGMTKGMAARLITHHISVQRIEENEGISVL